MTDFNRVREKVLNSDPITSKFWFTMNFNRNFEYRKISDVLTPNYRSRIANGEVIINPLSLIVELMLVPDDEILYSYKGAPPYPVPGPSASANWLRGCVGYVPQQCNFPIDGNGNFPGTVCNLDEGDELELRKAACMAFVDKPQYDFGEDLFELKETLDFLRSPLRSLSGLLHSFTKKANRHITGKHATAKSWLERAEAVADVWASYSFAARPLIQSVGEAFEAFNDETKLPFRRTSRSKGSLREETVWTTSGSIYGNWAEATVVNTKEVNYHVGIIYDNPLKQWQIDSFRAKLGLRNKDLPAVMWEILPLSFMVDRIANVKNTISGIVNLSDNTVKMKGGFVTRRARETHSVFMSGIAGNPDTAIVSYSAVPHIMENYTMTREEWLPGIGDTLAVFNPKELVNSVSKTADLASLILLRLGPITRSFLSR